MIFVMRQNPRKTFLCLVTLLWLTGISAQESNPLGALYQSEHLKQGDLAFQKAREACLEKRYATCEENLKFFFLTYYRHPRTWEARKLLSLAYSKQRKTHSLAKNELAIYRDFPNTEEGLTAYLESAKAMVRLGHEEEAVSILDDIIKNNYSSRIVQEAELEKKQLQILGEIEK